MFSRYSIISFFLTAVSLVVSFTDFGLPLWCAPAIATLAWIAGIVAVKIVTRPADMAASLTSLFSLGVTLDHLQNSFPWFIISMLLMGMSYATRPTFIRKMGYVKLPWWEPAFLVLAIAGYVYVNITVHAGWPGWALPAPVLFFAAFSTMGSMMDIISYKKGAKQEYIVQEGKEAPPFVLPDQEGETVALLEYRAKQLVLLLFVRGDWCPSCHIMLRVYEKHVEKFKDKNVLVMAIGPDPVGVNKAMVKKLNLDYKILADEKQEALKAYGVQYQDNMAGTKFETGIPMPASILIDKAGVVQYISRADRAGEFLNPMRIFSILEKL
jgi:peroxiredoxin